MNDYLQLFETRKLVLIMSLPCNEPALCRAAFESGADAVKVHINVDHRAGGTHFGRLAEDAGALARDAKALREACRTRTGEGRRLAVTEGDALSYACARMPATFAAAQRALELTLPCMPCEIGTVTDCGAGTGALTLAAFSALQPSRMLCLERESAMRGLGERITALEGVPAEWRDFDLVRQVVPPAELVCEGYMRGELAAGDRPAAVLKLWAAAEKMLQIM